MDADLAVPGLQIFKFESKCVVRASLFGVHVFIVSVIFFTRKIRNLLQSKEVTFFHDLALAARKAMESDAEAAMKVFAGIV